MITISAPNKPKAGSTFCVTVTGNVGSIDAVAKLGDVSIPVQIQSSNGDLTICVRLPDDAAGKVLTISVSDEKNAEGAFSRWVK